MVDKYNLIKVRCHTAAQRILATLPSHSHGQPWSGQSAVALYWTLVCQMLEFASVVWSPHYLGRYINSSRCIDDSLDYLGALLVMDTF